MGPTLTGSSLFDEPDDRIDGIGLTAGFHGLGEGNALCVESADCLEQKLIGERLFFQNQTKALFLEGTGIENLIAPAGCSGERNQQVRFVKGQQLADGVGARPGDDQIRQSEQILRSSLMYSYCT